MKISKAFLCAVAAIALLPFSAQAQDMLSVSVGWWDINDDEDAIDFRAEYRPEIAVLTPNLRPWVGAEVTSELSVWGGGGLLYDYNFSPNWYLTPSFGVGLYAQGSSDKDLGHPIEFRSQLEVAYEYESGQRAGIALSHLSNASLDDENPGTEVLSLYWHMPY